MKKRRRRFVRTWKDEYIRKPYKVVDLEAIQNLMISYKKYGQVNSVMHYINFETLKMAYHSLTLVEDDEGIISIGHAERAAGIDKVTKEMYGKRLDKNISKLLIRMKQRRYKARTVLRTYIPKEPKIKIVEGKEILVTGQRPLSIPVIEDGILQVCIVNQILAPITEEIFTEESFGYRPNRGVKDAIAYIEEINFLYNTKYALVLDNRAYFDSINREKLMDMVKEIIKDKRFIKLIKEILNAKYLDKEDNKIKEAARGIYQGLNISPVLANLYLHKVIDSWYKTIETKEEIFMVRYADDIIILGSYKEDIDKVLEEIKNRFDEYNLTIAEDKSRKINLEEEDLTYLGYRIHKDGRRIFKYISDKKVRNIKLKIENIITDSLEDWKDPEVGKYIHNILDYGKYLRDYIREINNLLGGIYITYKNTSNPLALLEIYDYASDEVRKHWSNIIGKDGVDFMINKIIVPDI